MPEPKKRPIEETNTKSPPSYFFEPIKKFCSHDPKAPTSIKYHTAMNKNVLSVNAYEEKNILNAGILVTLDDRFWPDHACKMVIDKGCDETGSTSFHFAHIWLDGDLIRGREGDKEFKVTLSPYTDDYGDDLIRITFSDRNLHHWLYKTYSGRNVWDKSLVLDAEGDESSVPVSPTNSL